MLCFRQDCSIHECEPNEVPTCWTEEEEIKNKNSYPTDNTDENNKDPLKPPRSGIHPSKSSSSSSSHRTMIDTLSRIDLNTSSSSSVDKNTSNQQQSSLPFSSWSSPLTEGTTIGNGRYDKKNVWGNDNPNPNNNNDADGSNNALHINLLKNPEGYSGYDGLKIWEAIYKENCFHGTLDGMCLEERVLFRLLSGLHTSINTHIAMTYNEGQGLLLGATDLYEQTTTIEDYQSTVHHHWQSLWSWVQDQWVIYTGGLGGLTRRSSPEAFTPGSSSSSNGNSNNSRTINNTLVADNIIVPLSIDRLILTPGLVPSVPLYIERIGKYPERIKNLYFAYLFIVRAVAKATPALLGLNLTTGNTQEDTATNSLLQQLLKVEIPSVVQGFDETAMFRVRKEELLDTCPPILHGLEDLHDLQQRYIARAQEKSLLMEQFREKFQNISRILDCVGCEKCRLWGKLQFLGLGTALKILFADADTLITSVPAASKPSFDLHITRNEAVALINVLHRLSMSISAVQVMRDLEVQSKLQYIFTIIFIIVLFLVSLITAYCWYQRRRRTKRIGTSIIDDKKKQ